MGFILNGKSFAIRSAELFASVPSPQRRCAYWPRKYDPADDPRPFWSLEVWVDVFTPSGARAADREPVQ